MDALTTNPVWRKRPPEEVTPNLRDEGEMAIPSYAVWYEATKRNFGNYRSGDLTAVGTALQRYNNSRSPDNLDRLWDALLRHKQRNPKEFANRDNSSAMTNLHGAVQEARAVAAVRALARPGRQPRTASPVTGRPAVPMRSRQHKAAPPIPPRNASRATRVQNPATVRQARGDGVFAGQKIREQVSRQDGGGKTSYEITIQDKGSNCGPTCIKMVIKRLWRADVSVSIIEGSTATAEGAPVHNWETEGTAAIAQGFQNALRTIPGRRQANITEYGVPGKQSLMSGLNQIGPKVLAIVRIGWTSGGGHFVVVPQWTDSRQAELVVLDPWFGLKTVSMSGGSPGLYQPEPGTTATLDWLTLVRITGG